MLNRIKDSYKEGAEDFIGKIALKVALCKARYGVKLCQDCKDQDICFKKRFEVSK